MRKNKIYSLLIGLAALIALISCKEEYEPINNRIYISDALTKNVKKVPVNVGEITQTNFTVRIADKVANDVHATLIVDETILKEYNEKMSATYSLLPTESFSFDKDIVIKSNTVSATPTVVTINPYEAAEGVKYALPIKVVGDGSVQEEAAGSQYLLLLDKPWSQSTPYLGSGSGFKSDSDFDPIPLDNFTIEFWLWIDRLNVTNQAIVTNDAFYIRIGNDNGQITTKQMQINIFGPNGMNEKLFFNKADLQVETWTHVAMAYDQEKCYYYLNGEKAMEIAATGVPYAHNGITFFDQSIKANHMMGQARLWNKVLSQAEIQENMTGPIMANTPGLVGYWKMDEGEGDVVYDSTNNGRHATKTSASPVWKADQCFTKK